MPGAVRIERQRHIDDLVLDQALIADFDPQRVKKHDRVDRIERSVLPFPHLVEDGVGDPADQVGDADANQRTDFESLSRMVPQVACAKSVSWRPRGRAHIRT